MGGYYIKIGTGGVNKNRLARFSKRVALQSTAGGQQPSEDEPPSSLTQADPEAVTQ